jgi:hypothetical protein
MINSSIGMASIRFHLYYKDASKCHKYPIPQPKYAFNLDQPTLQI